MKQWILAALLMAAPLVAGGSSQMTAEKTQAAHKEVDTDQLKAWYDQNKPMVVIDARSGPYFDGTLLPQAKWIPAEGPGQAPEKQIKDAVPNKDTLVVVYCAGIGCPASGWVAEKMTSMGYTNVYEYTNGLRGWMEKKYPTTKIQKTK